MSTTQEGWLEGKMDWIDERRISRCSNDDDDGERKNRRETREDDNKQPASQVTWLQGGKPVEGYTEGKDNETTS